MELTKNERILVCGHRGLVGSAIFRHLKVCGFVNIITAGRGEIDFCQQEQVAKFFSENKFDIVILAAAKVGGINANISYPADFIYDNLMIQNNVIHQSYLGGVKKLVFLGSSCIYPRQCKQPMKEEYLLTGKLEPTNEGYAIAKIAGLKMCEYYTRQYGFETLSLMPCNIYGPGEKFDLKNSHVLSALVKRFVDAKNGDVDKVVLWGTGKARREFLHVDDLARAAVYILGNYDNSEFINIGSGSDVSIKELAEMISGFVGYSGRIEWDTDKPDGMMKKCLDVSRMNAIGFKPEISLEAGIQQMIDCYKEQLGAGDE